MVKQRIARLTHCHAFQTAHGVSHVAYFVAVLAEGHGMYAVIGGVMVVFSLLNVVSTTEPS